MTSWGSAVSLAVSLSMSSSGIVQEAAPAESEPPAEETGVEEPKVEEPTAEAAPEPKPEPAAQPEPDLGDALLVEARERYVEGGRLFGSRRYLEAAAAYERSYAAVPVGKTLYNVALSYEKGGDYVSALDAYLRYLDLPGCPAPQEHCADRRGEVTDTVTKLRGKVGTLSIMIDDGVEVQGFEIDDRFIPPEDFPMVLTPGRYEFRVRGLRRNEVRTREVEILAGQITSLVIGPFNAPDPAFDGETREPEGDGVAAPSRRLSEEERRRRLRIAFYGGVGATALAGIATGVVGGLALQAHNEFERRCRGEGIDCTGSTYPQDAFDRVQQLRPATNALIGVTAGLGITTVVLGLFAFSNRQGAGARASVTRVQPSPGGVRVRF